MARAAGIPLVVNYFRRWDSKIRQLAQEFEGLGRPLRVEAVYGKGTRNYGSHLVNLLSFFFGPIHHVQSESLEIEQRNLPDPSISAVLQLETGLRASIIGIDHAGYDLLEIDVYYADRKITLQAGGISVATTMATGGIYFPGYAHLDFSNPTIEHSKVHGLLAAYQEIGQALETGSHPVTNTGESALETSRVLDAIIASAESGKRISL